jgi:hypothetical protein
LKDAYKRSSFVTAGTNVKPLTNFQSDPVVQIYTRHRKQLDFYSIHTMADFGFNTTVDEACQALGDNIAGKTSRSSSV